MYIYYFSASGAGISRVHVRRLQGPHKVDASDLKHRLGGSLWNKINKDALFVIFR